MAKQYRDTFRALTRAATRSSFLAPTWLWMIFNIVLGALSGHACTTWGTRLFFPLAFGPAMAIISVFDKRTMIRRFEGGKALWAQVPWRIKMLFMIRQFFEILLLVTVPGVVAALVAGFFFPIRLITFLPGNPNYKPPMPRATLPASVPASLPTR